MVRLIVQFSSEGLPFDWDAGEFACRTTAQGAAAMIQRETIAALEDGEDVEYLGHRIEAVGGRA